MEPLDFLAVVLPTPGHGFYGAGGFTANKKEHISAADISQLLPTATAWVEQKKDVFFALATFEKPFENNRGRTAENARHIKALFVDLDCAEDGPKTYGSKKEGMAALTAFMAHTGLGALGDPYIISSGGGIHAYWPLTKTIDIETWKPVAENFKRLCAQEGLKIDMTVTADAARVLRLPGTKNFKTKYAVPRAVQVKVEGVTFELDALSEVIRNKLVKGSEARIAVPKLDIPGSRPKNMPMASGVKLMANSTTSFKAIWIKTEEGGGCGQIKRYVDNAADDGMEPIWRGILSWTQKCTDGLEYAKQLSDMHPYEPERMHQKLSEIKGPYACLKMDSENPGVCTKCQHFGKITNPLQLGRGIVTDNTEKEITLSVPQEDYVEEAPPAEDIEESTLRVERAPEVKVIRPKPPRGFSYGEKGGVYATVKDKAADGKDVTREVQILTYDLFVVNVLKQEDGYTTQFIALRPDKNVTLELPSKHITSKDETVKIMAAQNIIASFGQGNDKNLYSYVRACVEEATLTRKSVEVPIQCGWQKTGSFVYNNRVFGKDGTEANIPMPGLENINRATNSGGTLEDWRKFWDMMIRKKQYTMLANCLDSFGCALLKFTEYDGFVWHIGSTESGTGKSLTLAAKAGVWGHPIRFRTGKGTSPVAMQQRAGLLNSMPLLIDEITSKSRNDMEWAPTFIFDLAEGQGKERMESGSNKERINNSTWSLTCTMTSNTHLTDYMSGARKHSSNGELLRMLEWTPNKPLVWEDEDREALDCLKHNYGVAGEAWVRWLVCNQDVVRKVLRDVMARLKIAMEFVDDERYWHAGCATSVTSAILLGPKYANILDVPVVNVMEALKELVQNARKSMKRNVRTAEDVLNAYTRDNYGSFIVIRSVGDGKILKEWGNGTVVDKSITRAGVLGRVEHGTLNPRYVEYFIEEQLLKQHCVSMSFGYADFRAQLEALHKVTYVKKDMLAKTSGPTMRVNVMHISRLSDEITDDKIPVGSS